MELKSIVAMVCVTVLGLVHLILYGDGSTLMACVTAIAALAGVQLGSEIQQKKSEG
jgi:hypothetical protein